METAVSGGELQPVHLAYLTDRLRTFEGKPQLYGTQGQTNSDGLIVPFPIEDEEHVDERREAIGLEPLEEYFKSMNESYKTDKK